MNCSPFRNCPGAACSHVAALPASALCAAVAVLCGPLDRNMLAFSQHGQSQPAWVCAGHLAKDSVCLSLRKIHV